MRTINVAQVEETIERLFLHAEYHLPDDLIAALQQAGQHEKNDTAKEILEVILENARIAEGEKFPLCQDTGMAFIFLEVGQEITFTGGSLQQAIHKGVENAYQRGYLRKSVVSDPLRRKNTGTNLPPIVYTEITDGDQLKLTVIPKGFGAENQSGLKMMTPSATKADIIKFISDGVIASGSKGCPPCIIGVGLGGSFEYSALLAKKALLLPIDQHHDDPFYAEFEEELLAAINQSGIGPMGMGGTTTALSVRVKTYPTHIAGLPVAYNYCCHSMRHSSITI